MTEITFVTGNANKLREVSQILSADADADAAFRIVPKKLNIPELQGDPDEIARQKCLLAVKEINGPTVSSSAMDTHRVHHVEPWTAMRKCLVKKIERREELNLSMSNAFPVCVHVWAA